MAIEIRINDSLDPKARYITYAASACQIRQTPAAAARTVTLSSRAAVAGGGEAVFYATRAVGTQLVPTLTVTLPAAGTWVNFGLGGKLGKPSVEDRDCLLVATAGRTIVRVPLMVRVRKNANKLTTKERDRFLMALAKLNSAAPPAVSAYQTLRNMHVTAANGEEHSRALTSYRGTGVICWTSSVGCRRSIRRCPCITGASTRRRQTSSPDHSWVKRDGRPQRPPL